MSTIQYNLHSICTVDLFFEMAVQGVGDSQVNAMWASSSTGGEPVICIPIRVIPCEQCSYEDTQH